MKEAASVPPFLMTIMIIMTLVEVMVMVMKVWIKLKGLSIQCHGDTNMIPTNDNNDDVHLSMTRSGLGGR